MLIREGQRGLTLLELMVGLAIMGFALVAIMPSVSDWMQNLAVRNSADSIKAGLERARQEALRRNANVTFWLVSDTEKVLTSACVRSNSGPSYVVSSLDPTGKCGNDPSTTDDPRIAEKWSAAQGGANVLLKTQNAAGDEVDFVTFNSLGQPGAGQLTRIDFDHAAGNVRKLRLLVDAGGSVRVCDPDPGLSSTDPRRCG